MKYCVSCRFYRLNRSRIVAVGSGLTNHGDEHMCMTASPEQVSIVTGKRPSIVAEEARSVGPDAVLYEEKP